MEDRETHREAVAVAVAAAPAGIGRDGVIQADLRLWHVALWLGLLGLAATLATLDASFGWLAGLSGMSGPVEHSALLLLVLALACEFVDATIGMGYGTTLTPILIILGYPVGMIVPAALLSQFVANVAASYFHHSAGNYNFWKDHRTRNVGLLMGGVGLVISFVTMQAALKVPDRVLRIGITLMVLGIGVFMLVGSRLKVQFRMRNVGILAGVAAFNKAFSGGGYGPLVCGGQVLVGLPVRAAVASTALAEALVCIAAVGSFYVSGRTIPMFILLPLVAGALLSTPASAITLNRLPQALVKRLMAIAIVFLGAYALWQGKGI